MRCKRHTVNLSSSTAGVCASCLRERLLSLAASAAVAEDDNHHHQSRKSNNLIFPRSVSPYVTRRKSDAVNRRFIATPQVETGFSCKDFESNRSSTKPKASRRISNLFRASRSDDFDSDTKSRVSCSSSSSSSRSWISSLLSRKQSATTTTAVCYIEDVVSGRRPQRVFCRGMSPAREDENEPPSSESRRTPAMKTPGRRRIAAGIGMGFCLSPLVRASPNCPFKRKINGSVSEVTATEKPHIAEAASFCANRSKKLVDIGRVNHRR
ncbi:hypothetical protein Bca4012_021738 [Brassica carinata]